MSNHIKSIIFAAVLSIVCGSLLTLASTGLKEYHLKNIALDKQKNILKSVGLIQEDKALSTDTIEELYTNSIRQMWVDFEGKIVPKQQKGTKDLPVYLHVKNGNIQSYIIPVDSRGLWGRISGYLALKKDGVTVSGFTVYNHSETPGLGGEIEKRWFQKNFAGKKIIDDRGKLVSVAIAKGRVADKIPESRQKNFVDGISGATLTGKFLSGGLKLTLIEYEPLLKKIQKKED
jgi:Na+-transporting NADH:ubiquinone oxidoreductase subunit C